MWCQKCNVWETSTTLEHAVVWSSAHQKIHDVKARIRILPRTSNPVESYEVFEIDGIVYPKVST